jgi:hypothetical protein
MPLCLRNRGSTKRQPLMSLMPSSTEFGLLDCLPINWTKGSMELFHHCAFIIPCHHIGVRDAID